MAFWTELITTVVKMILLVAVAYGGVRLGKVFRDRTDAKKAAEEASAELQK